MAAMEDNFGVGNQSYPPLVPTLAADRFEEVLPSGKGGCAPTDFPRLLLITQPWP